MHLKVSMSVMWLCQIPARFCFYVRTVRLVRVVVVLLLVMFYCEFLHYYLVLLCCTWPRVPADQPTAPVRAMFIGDTHILGSNAHWFDKLRREWQMTRSFQASMMIHHPDVVFILGDLLDNGKVCSKEEFTGHVTRFKRMFSTPHDTESVIVVGNHDVGFHYMITDKKAERFKSAFDSPSVRLLSRKGVLFVLVNSMALEGDGCHLCREAQDQLTEIKWKLKCSKGAGDGTVVAKVCENQEHMKYSRPILLQHFPMYRTSDSNCSTPDAAPEDEKYIPFREKWDCISRESSQMLFDMLDPRLIISAHTHHGCYRLHDNDVPEYTVASFNWRNKDTPTFLLAEITAREFVINRCYLPSELTVISMYVTGGILVVICVIVPPKKFKHCQGIVPSNKSH